VVTRPPKRASDTSLARLAARLRQRGSTLLVLGTWPQSEAMLSLTASQWTGIGEGHGHLAARQVTVTVSSRLGEAPRSARLWLPDPEQKFRDVDPGIDTGNDSGIEAVPGDARERVGMPRRHLRVAG